MDSFFRTLIHEAVGPFFVSLDDAPDTVIDVPDTDEVRDLDVVVSLADQLDILVGEGLADHLSYLHSDRAISELADLVDEMRQHCGLLVPPALGWRELIDEIDKYGAAIERDLMDIPNAPRL
ncbi:hypothetical protein [Rhodococcoides fascians]|uniref:hypothetical protein n=1 Tax=Rhodococcoides fascians TaxID=1828 RepID=UPI00050C4443|nr:hypothetical protein [Rhodococcus fascians]